MASITVCPTLALSAFVAVLLATSPTYAAVLSSSSSSRTSYAEQPRCYEVGQRCKGAPGFPRVPWLGENTAPANGGCCGTATCSEPAKEGDYGTYCTNFFSEPHEPITRCTSSAARCKRDKGGVVLLGCCSGYEECTGGEDDVCAVPERRRAWVDSGFKGPMPV